MMALPKIDLPLFELTLPSTGKKVKYRPFTVKEEKVLLVAQEADDPKQEILAAKQVVNNCLIDQDVEDLPMFDLEYVLLLLRSKSVDNNVQFSIQDPETEERVDLEIDLEKVMMSDNKEHSKEVNINEDYKLFLKYPNIDNFINIADMDPTDPLVNYYIMVSCLDYIASEDEVHHFEEYTKEEIDSFMDNMTGQIIKDIQQFFFTMPKLRHEVKYTNKNGTERTFVLEGMRSFFV